MELPENLIGTVCRTGNPLLYRCLLYTSKGVNEMCKVMEDLRNESYVEFDGNCH